MALLDECNSGRDRRVKFYLSLVDKVLEIYIFTSSDSRKEKKRDCETILFIWAK